VTASTLLLDPLMSERDADVMVELCETFGPYGLYAVEKSETEFAPELTQRVDAARNHVRTGGRFARSESTPTLALRTNYLRETYAYGDTIYVDGIEAFRTHPALIEAARSLFGRSVIEPAIVYANLLLPGQELAVHTDVPEFRGANRKVIPQWLLVVMHHSRLFDAWRMPIATGIAYFAPLGEEAVGGELAYYPDGPDGEPRVLAARHNTAIVLDTDSVFHGVDRVGPLDVEPFAVEPGNVLVYDGDRRWSIRPTVNSGEHLYDLRWNELRFSISWKAYCFADDHERNAWRTHADDLSLERILDELRDDLAARGVLAKDAVIADRDLALLLIDTYERYPTPRPPT
jgi:hypothetical protein